ncbi:MAG: hydrogenase nickel incorporation protein HypB [Lachnospiraceae bacterium]|nr:hydrogenase nickel incorporation protein HypB [Lachnospiraceae bacterium]
MKVIELKKSITASNDEDARKLRRELSEKKILLVNLMSSAGAGKTTLLQRIAGDLGKRKKIAVIEADIDSDTDAVKLEKEGIRSIQVHTDGMCHMDAGMTGRAVKSLGSPDPDIIFLENVGNLICPAQFDTGAHLDIMLLDVSEGDDKPLKYPLMFAESDALVITKTDALPFFSFDIKRCSERALRFNPGLRIFTVSAKTGEGMDKLEEYIELMEG